MRGRLARSYMRVGKMPAHPEDEYILFPTRSAPAAAPGRQANASDT